MRFGPLIVAMAALMSSAPALAQTPAFDPRSWKGQHAGPPTQVLTLGSAHLRQLEKPVTAAMLVPLLDKLAAFKPDIITHEGLSGEQCDIVNRYAERYPGIYRDYCWGTDEGEKATGLSVPAAMAQVEKMLATWPAQPSAAQRRQLAAIFLAAGDRPSAQVQWLQLPPAERRVGDTIDIALVEILTRNAVKENETYAIAVALAVRLGLNRVYAVDDHTADSIQALAGSGFETAVQDLWNAPNNPAMATYKAAEKQAAESGDTLAFYRLLNTPETQRLFVSFDFGEALKQKTPELYGRQYVAWYETRNLRMVANIRAAFGNTPGARVLNVVGASHKAYYDAYLDMMHEVKLVDVGEVLR
jgi:hypothetical protein